MNAEALKELSELLEKLTHSGDPSLDQTLMKRVKTLCKTSELIVRASFELLMKHLSKEHSEIRFSSFQILNELFQRSHSFRILTVDEFQNLISLVCGVESRKPLPPPKPVAEKLKKESLLAIKNWTEKYGDGYPKLKLGYQYLKYNKKVDFDGLVAATEGELRRREESERRNKAFIEQRLKELTTEFKEEQSEILMCIKEMESCFRILMPTFDMQQSESRTDSRNRNGDVPYVRFESTSSASFVSIGDDNDEGAESDCKGVESDSKEAELDDKEKRSDGNGVESDEDIKSKPVFQTDYPMNETESDSSDSEVEWEDVGMRPGDDSTDGGGAHGMIGSKWNITFEVPGSLQVLQGEDNESLVEVLRENYKLLIRKYLKNISKWIEWFTKGDKESLLKEVISVKELVLATIEKYNELDIVDKDQDGSSDDEARLTEGVSPHDQPLLSPTREKSGLFSSHEGKLGQVRNEIIQDPTTPQAQLLAGRAINTNKTKKQSQQSLASISSSTSSMPSSSKDAGDKDVPVVPFDVDLINWGNLKGPAPTIASISNLHHFWCEDKDISISEDHRNSLKCRVISFPGEFKPISRSCNAPLGNGKLCPRKDKQKCPFHGVIVPRDEFGVPVRELPTISTGTTDTTGTTGSGSTDVETTVADCDDDGSSKGKSGKKKRKRTVKHPGLTNLKKLKETPQSRIEGKILNKRTLKRVGTKMTNFERKLKNDKFSDNFNYALKQ